MSAPSGIAADPQICETAAAGAARSTGVPLDVLRTIALAESGRSVNGRLAPWPWAVNLQGAGRWFETPQAALGFVSEAREQGARNIDIGCFQINYRWHGHHFSSLEEMFEPQRNALYAARFLAQLFDEFGNWEAAAGAYHSRTPALAERYSARFEALRTEVHTAPAQGAAAESTFAGARDDRPRHSGSYPLLTMAGPGALGSLVTPAATPRPELISLAPVAASLLP